MSRHQFSDLTRNALGDIWSRVALHNQIQALIEQSLPRAFLKHVKVACIDAQTLVLCTDTPLWAADLRYRTAAILDGVNNKLKLDLTRCLIQVRPGAFSASDS